MLVLEYRFAEFLADWKTDIEKGGPAPSAAKNPEFGWLRKIIILYFILIKNNYSPKWSVNYFVKIMSIVFIV